MRSKSPLSNYFGEKELLYPTYTDRQPVKSLLSSETLSNHVNNTFKQIIRGMRQRDRKSQTQNKRPL